jgi:hypothetical protein
MPTIKRLPGKRLNKTLNYKEKTIKMMIGPSRIK